MSMSEKVPSGGTKSSAMLSSNLMSSPPRAPSARGKERKNPSITPRKFKRFFTPRSRVSSRPSAARKALHDLTAPALNRSQTPSSPLKPISEEDGLDGLPSLQNGHRSSKRRKMLHTPDRAPLCHLPSPFQTSPALLQSPDMRPREQSPIRSLRFHQADQDVAHLFDGLSHDEEDDEDEPELPEYTRPVPLSRRGLGAQLVQRVTGGLGRASDRRLECPVADWRTDTADFYSKPEDVHVCSSHEGAPRAIPFCTTSCHKNSLVAVGDEEGYVRLLDSSNDFSKTHLSFQAHGNAIIDMEFSPDDLLLATASGDQTGRVIDMTTQTPISILGYHTASLKQVRFQPGRGSNAVLATSGRDGSVQIWDLRCRGGPVQDVVIRSAAGLHHSLPRPINPGCVVNSIYDAHARTLRQPQPSNPQTPRSATGDVARTGEVPGRIGEVSVTALQFLPPGREHLLLTACEADASIKLWDIRATHTSRNNKNTTPISYTATPPSHAAWRPFGISSMALGGNGSRLYALCKDNTVYAYSTAHLVLGHAAELAPAQPGLDPPRRRHHAPGSEQQGLGPIYGFRHPLFHATSFYVKAAIRPAADGRAELLAVGSSDGCAVLFPTDERYVQDVWARGASDESYLVGDPTAGTVPGSRRGGGAPPGLVRANSLTNSNIFTRQADTMPIVRSGTPLVRGHSENEVGALAWASNGKLVTVGDDYMVRCWSEGREEAMDLRLGGEASGRRWGCGWADVGDAWEGDQDDW
ncbi:WD40-repeat-containing domain protein [Podospora appendiculata]|uniref:WD40-repeat-containing domain protein n=1 Tax=Podospora appendiculata TaxID=314037 RepID=A0AAE0X622_9PEZI|nr:WD40-repeat-containing domain protein [Podospora appendiculata]